MTRYPAASSTWSAERNVDGWKWSLNVSVHRMIVGRPSSRASSRRCSPNQERKVRAANRGMLRSGAMPATRFASVDTMGARSAAFARCGAWLATRAHQ